jgi:WD40 repeat protein
MMSGALTPDSRRFFSASWEGAVLWDWASGKLIRRFEGHADAILTIAVSPDGKRALTGGGGRHNKGWTHGTDNSICLWELETGRLLHRYEGHTHGVWGLAFSPDGRRFLSGSMDGTLRLWGLPK